MKILSNRSNIVMVYDFFEKMLKVPLEKRDEHLDIFIKMLDDTSLLELANFLVKKPELEREKLIKQFFMILKEENFYNIVSNISEIVNEPPSAHRGLSRQYVLGTINRFTESAKKHDSYDHSTKIYTPVLNSGNKKYLIEVNFAGLGSEVNEKHYAIVWEQEPWRDHIVVIPTTSLKDTTKIKPTLFNIGKVDFMTKETVVKLDQITTISRKKIKNIIVKDYITGETGIAVLSNEQVMRIEEGLEILYFGAKTLYRGEIENIYRNRLPSFIEPLIQFEHLHRQYKIIRLSPEKVEYQLLNDPSRTTYILYRNKTSINTPKRKALLKTWINASASYDKSQKPWKLIKNRTMAIQDAYNEIQNHITQSSSLETS